MRHLAATFTTTTTYWHRPHKNTQNGAHRRPLRTQVRGSWGISGKPWTARELTCSNFRAFNSVLREDFKLQGLQGTAARRLRLDIMSRPRHRNTNPTFLKLIYAIPVDLLQPLRKPLNPTSKGHQVLPQSPSSLGLSAMTSLSAHAGTTPSTKTSARAYPACEYMYALPGRYPRKLSVSS